MAVWISPADGPSLEWGVSVPLTVRFAELEPLDLSRGRLRQVGPGLDPSRILPRSRRGLHERAHLLEQSFAWLLARLEDHERLRLHESVLVHLSDDRRLEGGAVPEQGRLHLER